MPSDRPPPAPRPPGSDPAGRRRTTGAVRDGTLVFALVLGGFVAYALGARATYRATAIVAVEAPPGSGQIELPKTAEAIERLRRAALDPGVVSRLASEERPVPPETAVQVGARISNALSVQSSDGRSFTFMTTASGAERAQYLVNEFAQQAAKRAAQVLDPQPQLPGDPGARAKTELLEFLAAHPDIASEPSTAPARSGPDPLVLALRAEKTRIEQKLSESPAAPGDNPYDEPGPLEKPEFLKRRLKEIDDALEARAKPPAPASAQAKEPNAALRAEWQRLLRAVSESRSSEPAPPPAPRLRVTLARAGLPRLPIEPNRPRLVLVGVLVAGIGGVVAGFFRSMFEGRARRRYGMTTGEHPIALPQTTLRLSRDQLPKPAEPMANAPPTPVPSAPPSTGPITPIPQAPLVPAPITPIPPMPIAPIAITPVPPAPLGPAGVTPLPPAPKADAPTTPVPPRSDRGPPLAPTLIASIGGAKATSSPPEPTAPADTATAVPAPATATERPPATLPTSPPTSTPPAPMLPTPIPPGGVAPPAGNATPIAPLVVQGPSGTGPDLDKSPTTQGYGKSEKPARAGRNAPRRTTKIYGTPPPPTLEEEAKALRTTQAYGSPPVAIPPHRPEQAHDPQAAFEAEVVPPEHKSNLRPTPMIPIARTSSIPPPVTPATRSGAPLAETGYSYVQTPVPQAHAIPQTPLPRRPSPPPRTEPYGSVPPVQARAAYTPSQTQHTPNPGAATPTAPEPVLNAPAVALRTHPVASTWRPDTALSPARKRALAAEILTLAVERCLVIGVTGTRGSAEKKSIAAAELALALAEAKHPRVLLMESDFQFPQVQKWLGLDVPFVAGFSQQLRGRIDSGREGRWHVVECRASLHVLAEGVMRSPGLLLSNQFEQAMRELRGYYDIIVIDAPIAPNESDGQAIADVVDGAVVVGPASRAGDIMEVSRIFSGKKLLRVIES